MAFSINKLAVANGPGVYYDDQWRHVLETHLTWIATDPATQTVSPTAQERFKFEGDLYGYLTHNAIPAHLHWLIMRINNMVSPTEFGEQFDTLFVPSEGTVNRLLTTYSSVYGRPV